VVSAEVCVAFPARSALAEGYDVFVATDASGTFNEVTRHSAWNRMAAAGAQLMTWFGIACELHRDWRNGRGKDGFPLPRRGRGEENPLSRMREREGPVVRKHDGKVRASPELLCVKPSPAGRCAPVDLSRAAGEVARV
jgi:hypothetical protein